MYKCRSVVRIELYFHQNFNVEKEKANLHKGNLQSLTRVYSYSHFDKLRKREQAQKRVSEERNVQEVKKISFHYFFVLLLQASRTTDYFSEKKKCIKRNFSVFAKSCLCIHYIHEYTLRNEHNILFKVINQNRLFQFLRF